MVFAVLCSVLALLTFAEVAEKDACDNKRLRADCIASPEICYWDSTKEETGHACVKFSGDCRSIRTNNSGDCTGAGGSGLCEYLNPNVCVNKCNLLNNSNADCDNQHNCFFTPANGPTPAKCEKCDEINDENDCKSKRYCKWNASSTSNRCSIDSCSTLYPENYYSFITSDCMKNTSCYVNGNNLCKEFADCASISNSIACDSREGCYYGTLCQVGSRTTCGTYILRDVCLVNVSCYWDSSISKCLSFSRCNYVETGNSSDCNSARRDYGDGLGAKNCTWKQDLGCVPKCTDYPLGSSSSEWDCRARADCWWDSGTCKDFSTCQSLDQSACGDHEKTCFWNYASTNPTCSNYTHCSDIKTRSGCESAGSHCKWNTSVCVDICTEIKNEYDCWDRSDCKYNGGCLDRVDCSMFNLQPSYCNSYSYTQGDCYSSGGICGYITNCNVISYADVCDSQQGCYYDFGCLNFTKCADMSYDACTGYHYPGPKWYNCVWENGNCVPELHSLANDTNNKGCSAYQTVKTCNAVSNCVWNQKINTDFPSRSQCQNFTNCSDITYTDFGGVFYEASDDCEAKPGCRWKETSDQRFTACRTFLGECGNDESVVLCSEYVDSVTCDSKSECYWDSSLCVPWACGLFDKLYCTGNSRCEWEEDTDSCKYKCSLYTDSALCRENTDCFWNVSRCDIFDECRKITQYEECWLRTFSACVWIGTNATDVTVGYCVNTTEKNDSIVRGCDDYKNADQCNEDTRYSSNGLECVFIWNAAHDGGNCTAANATTLTNCSVYKNKEQCINMTRIGYDSGCYWTGGGYCQEYINCTYIPTEDCESSKSCGVRQGKCGYYDCSIRTKEGCNGKCEWYRNKCQFKGSDVRSVQYMLGVGDDSDPCYSKSSNKTLCNSDKTMCGLGCVFNSQKVFGNSACIIFRNCSEIKYPLFQDPQTDCDSRIPCYWANGACGLDAPKPSNTKKSLSSGAIAAIVIVVAVVVFAIIVALLVLLYVFLRRKRKTGVGEDGSANQGGDVPAEGGEDTLGGSEEAKNVPVDSAALVGHEEGQESEVPDL